MVSVPPGGGREPSSRGGGGVDMVGGGGGGSSTTLHHKSPVYSPYLHIFVCPVLCMHSFGCNQLSTLFTVYVHVKLLCFVPSEHVGFAMSP